MGDLSDSARTLMAVLAILPTNADRDLRDDVMNALDAARMTDAINVAYLLSGHAAARELILEVLPPKLYAQVIQRITRRP